MSRKIALKPSVVKTCPYRANEYYYAIDENSYDGTNEVGVGPSAQAALSDLLEQLECPYCKEVTLAPCDRKEDLAGRVFTAYECSKCHSEVTFSG
jgi:DNA-directed RNA polymerase subunit RPC12/RpoP